MAQAPKHNLLIVESPGKLKTLRKILGPGWLLEASVGHTTELASDGHKKLGFDLGQEHVTTRYVPRGSRGREVLAKLRKAVKEVDTVYLATDPDREGEAIAWHLVEQLRLKRYVRVSYTQITEAAVKAAIARPGGLNLDLISSQRARQCLDKLVGFEVSPLLWNSTGGKSAGRVQSATLHLICERERERLAFKPENYWTLHSKYGEGFEAQHEPPAGSGPSAAMGAGTQPTAAAAVKSGGVDEWDIPRVRTEAEAKRLAQIARTQPHEVLAREQAPDRRYPPPPLITSSLQQTAGARHRFSPKHTMQVAQELYEGVGGKGLITYMRTDATTLSPEFVAEARDWISRSAPEALAERPPVYRAKSDAQAAHEAIRPTQASLTPELAAAQYSLSPDQLKLYRIIWERAMASQCKPASLSKTKITVRAGTGRDETVWVARGMTIVDPGYLRFWQNLENEKELPRVVAGQRLTFKDVRIDAKTTQPPSRYSEPKLVQLMEKKGIGRPSTYASTIATLKDRDYVVLEQNLLAPTPLGMATDSALGMAIPEIVDSEFTSAMETSLDRIAEGKLAWERYLLDWNRGYLEPAIVKAKLALQGVARVAPKVAWRGKGKFKKGGGLKTNRAGGTRARSPRKRAGPSPSGAKGRRAGRSSGRGAKRTPPSEAYQSQYVPQYVPQYVSSGPREMSDRRCPECGGLMQKIRSEKVTGGFFLKCGSLAHPDDVVMFKSRQGESWERPKS